MKTEDLIAYLLNRVPEDKRSQAVKDLGRFAESGIKRSLISETVYADAKLLLKLVREEK